MGAQEKNREREVILTLDINYTKVLNLSDILGTIPGARDSQANRSECSLQFLEKQRKDNSMCPNNSR